MQVIADEDFPAVRECQVVRFEKGEVITGDLARYLLETGAPVSEQVADVTAKRDAATTAEQGQGSTSAPRPRRAGARE